MSVDKCWLSQVTCHLTMWHYHLAQRSHYLHILCCGLQSRTAVLVTVLATVITSSLPAAMCSVHPSIATSSDVPHFSKPIENTTVVLGRTAVLECSVDNLGPYNKVAWLKMDSSNSEPTVLTIGTLALHGEKYRVSQNGHRQWFLHIRQVRGSDRGNYMCQVNAKSMISQVGFLDIQVPPIIIENHTSSDTTVDEHHKAVLKCTVKGYPKPKISWRRENGQQINLGLFGGKKYSAQTFDGEQLNLTQVTREDMGAYLCIATNGVPPSVSRRVLLHVNFRPKIRVQNQLISARLGSSVELTCQCEAYPRPLVTWMTPSGDPVLPMSTSSLSTPNANSSSSVSSVSPSSAVQWGKYDIEEDYQGYRTTMKLKINSLSTKDFGSFKCIAKNTLGEKEGLIRLYESQSPQFKNALSVHHQSNKNAAKANSLKSRKSLSQRQQQRQQLNGSSATDGGQIVQVDHNDDEFEEETVLDDDMADVFTNGPVQPLTDLTDSALTTYRSEATAITTVFAVALATALKWIWL